MQSDELINAYFDASLTDEQAARLNDWIKADPANAQTFARLALLHDRLRDQFADPEAELNQVPTPNRFRWKRPAFVAAAVVLLAALALIPALTSRRVVAAEAVLDRLIEAAGRAGDRTYRIVALDPDPLPEPPGRGRPRPPIDGALLHVRDGGQYVLIRQPGTPDAFITGSNGQEAWSIAPDGPVRVSSDPTRFRGAVPGEQQGLPFLDMSTALARLRVAYRLELPPGRPGTLRAFKKSNDFRGPRDVEIESVPATGEIQEIRLDGLPQAQGGPRSLALKRVHANEFGERFFEHESHHEPDRRVIHEPQE